MAAQTNAIQSGQPEATAAPNLEAMKLAPYLHFDGTCEEALRFYGEVFHGSVASMMRWADAPPEMGVSADRKQKIMHASFTSPAVELMAADGTADASQTSGSRISLSLGTRNLAEARRVFDELAADGTVTMPMQDTFWGAVFGMVTDKYGIDWMINAEKS